MNIINLTQNESGGYSPILHANELPIGCAEVVCDITVFYQYHGFVIPEVTIDNGKAYVVSFEGNQTALDAYLAEYPDVPETPQIDNITALQLAIAELAEAQATDQTANELALAELAEMIGG